MSDFDLSAFLTEQQAAGTSVGEGDFTVSHEKAALKISRYSLPREFSWVLKLVQAAVAASCSGISVTQTRNSSTIVFESEQPGLLPTIQDLVQAVLRISLESEQVTDRLGAALRLLVEKSHSSFLLRVDRGEGDAQAMYAGVYFGEMAEAARSRIKKEWKHPLCLQINHIPHNDLNRRIYNWVPIKDQALPLAIELERYAYVSPIPITLDGRRLDGVMRTGAMKWSPRKKPIRLAGIQIPGDGDPCFEICDGFSNQVLAVDEEQEMYPSSTPVKKVSEAYVVLSLETCRYRYEALERVRRTYLCWVKDGVVVEEEILKIPTQTLELRIYVSADGIGTDLTGFHLIRSSLFHERRGRVLRRVREVLLLEQGASRKLFSQAPESVEVESEQTFKDRLKTFRKTLKVVQDTLKDQTAYWDRLAIERAYKNDLHDLIQGVGQASEELGDRSGDESSRTRRVAVNVKEELPSFAPKEEFRWVPPEER